MMLARSPTWREHLRVCGAVETVPKPKYGPEGTSPRVRSGLAESTQDVQRMGNISACAERSASSGPAATRNREHLRVCGAVRMSPLRCRRFVGTSPRVRSGLEDTGRFRDAPGNISACAERSRWCRCHTARSGEHLRVCGAVGYNAETMCDVLGTSPRVRSGLLQFLGGLRVDRNISACAERSIMLALIRHYEQEHLRVCGAVSRTFIRSPRLPGTSPRVRSGPDRRRHRHHRRRNISACAERSRFGFVAHVTRPEHLRVCGAVSCFLLGFGLVGWHGMFDSCAV